MPAVLFLLGSGLLIATGVTIATAWPVRSPLLRVLAALVLTQAGLVSATLVAGLVLQRLDGAALLGVAAGQALLAVIAARRAGATRIRGADFAGDLRRSARALRHPVVLLALVAVVGSLLWRLFLAWRLPILDFDGLSYHMVTVDVWLQSDAIVPVTQRLQSNFWPANGELITLWLVAFFREDVLADATAVLAVPVLIVAVAALARQLGAPARLAALSGLVVGMMPAVMALGPSTYVDSWAAADVTAAWAFALAAVRAVGRPRYGLLVLTGVAMGLAVGVKVTFALAAAGLGGALVLGALIGGASRPSLGERVRNATRTGVALAVVGLLFGGYWYARNWAVHGNPVWPFHLGPFPGPLDFSYLTQQPEPLAFLPEQLWITAAWLSDFTRNRYLYDTRVGGFGVGFAILLALAVVGLTVALRSPRRWLLLAIVATALATLVTMPMGWWARYTLFIPALVAALAAVGLARLPPRPGGVLAVAVVLLGLWSLGVATARSNLITELGRAPPWLPEFARLAVTGDPGRTDLGLWATCSPLTELPAGAVVSADAFGLLHIAVGPHLERRLAPRVEPGTDAATWHADLVLAGTTHVVVGPSSRMLAGAQERTDLFAPLDGCEEAFLFEVRST